MDAASATPLASSVATGLLGNLLTAIIAFLVRRATLSRRSQDWLQTGHVEMTSATRGDPHVEELGHSILEFLARYLGAVAGAVFVKSRESDAYVRASTYGRET